MMLYLLRRVLWFLPTLFALSVLAFILSESAPGDPLNQGVGENPHAGGISKEWQKNKRQRLGLDLPLFYFHVGSLSDLPPQIKSQAMQRLAFRYGNPKAVAPYYQAIMLLNNPELQKQLLQATDIKESEVLVSQSGNDILKAAYESMKAHSSRWKSWIPSIHWNGTNSRYHRWISAIILHGDFGRSYADNSLVMQKLRDKLPWSVILALLSVILAYIVSIPAGIYAATHSNTWGNGMLTVLIFILYSIPAFFMGALLLLFFANPDMLEWFPVGGIGDPTLYSSEWGIWQRLSFWAPYLVLPLITYTYGGIAYLSRQVKSAMNEILEQDYIRTARAKGLSERKVVWKHAFRNALLPIITVFSGVFPLAIGGSVVIETLFSIPGMGLEIYRAVLASDYPVIIAVFLLYGFITLISYFIADILYAMADPRVRLE